MCKTYLVLACLKGWYNSYTTKLTGPTSGNTYSATFYDDLSQAQNKADEHARAGNIGIVYEAREFRHIKPVPVVVEYTECK